MICYEVGKQYMIPINDKASWIATLIEINDGVYIFETKSGDKLRLTAGFLIKNEVKEKKYGC